MSLIASVIRVACNREWAETVNKREKSLQTISKSQCLKHRPSNTDQSKRSWYKLKASKVVHLASYKNKDKTIYGELRKK